MGRDRKVGRCLLQSLQVVVLSAAGLALLLYAWALLTMDWRQLHDGDEHHAAFIRSRADPFLSSRKLKRPGATEEWAVEDLEQLQAGRSPAASNQSMSFRFTDAKYQLYTLPEVDTSLRCSLTGICDGNFSCGPDRLGCVTNAKERQEKIREAAKWSWAGYRKFAWGHDEVGPGSHQIKEWFGLGVTIVDSLDTLLILGLKEEYAEARQWVAHHFDPEAKRVSTFETTIRILGGLVSAFYHSDGDELYLRKAVSFAERLMPAFNTTAGTAISWWVTNKVSAADRAKMAFMGNSGGTNLAEAGSLSMEFSALSHLTGRSEFREAAMTFWYNLLLLENTDGLFCTSFDGDNLRCIGHHYSLGAAADSMYEYMLKQWVLSAGTDEVCLEFYRRAMVGVRKHMVMPVKLLKSDSPMWIVAEVEASMAGSTMPPAPPGAHPDPNFVLQQYPRLEHLTCFFPGLLTLGHMYGINTTIPGVSDDDDLLLAAKLMRACYFLYDGSPSGVAYDSVQFQALFPSPPPRPPFPPMVPRPPLPPLPPSPPSQTPPSPPLLPPAQLSSSNTAPPLPPQASASPPVRVLADVSQGADVAGTPSGGFHATGPASPTARRMAMVQQQAQQQLGQLGQGEKDVAMGEAELGRSIGREHASLGDSLGQRSEATKQGSQGSREQRPRAPWWKVMKAAHRRVVGLVLGQAYVDKAGASHADVTGGGSLRQGRASSGAQRQGVARARARTPEEEEMVRAAQAREQAQAELVKQGMDERVLNAVRARAQAAIVAAAEAAMAATKEATRAAAAAATHAADEEASVEGAAELTSQESSAQAGAEAEGQGAGLEGTKRAAARSLQAGAPPPWAPFRPMAPRAPPSPPQPPRMPPFPPAPPPPPPIDWSKLSFRMDPLSYSDFLRPEVVESLFYLYRATGDDVYREWGWSMFRAFEMFCKVPTGGYTVLSSVEKVPTIPGDKMESFWLAETLKYFYLLFSDDPNVIPLDKYVFNTEAHPLPIWGTEHDIRVRRALQHRLRERQKEAAQEASEE